MSSISDSIGGLRETLVNSDVNYQYNKHYLIIGKRATGKTNFIINNIYSKISNEIDNIYIFTASHNYKYYEKITDLFYDIKDVNLVLGDLIKEYKNKKTKTLVIFDNVINNIKFYKNNELMELFYNARHYEITLIATMEYPLGITPDLRLNFDYVITAQENFHSNIQRLYEHYFGFYQTLNIFKEVLECLKVYEFLVLQVGYKNKVGIEKTLTDSNYKFIASKNIDEIKIIINEKKFLEAKTIIKELNETIDNLVGIRDRLKKLDL
jgi:hypothetical protein